MKRKTMGYIGVGVSAILLIILFVMDLSKLEEAGGVICFASLFSFSCVQLLHEKMLRTNLDYQIESRDERNIAINEKAGNITNRITLLFMGIATVALMAMDYFIPAMITGAIVGFQPLVLLLVSASIEKKM